MIAADGRPKLTDFGISLDLSQTVTKEFYHKPPTPHIIAPEVYERNKPYSEATDWWSYGCLLYEMASGKPVFTGITPF